jgi:hypothetical protein
MTWHGRAARQNSDIIAWLDWWIAIISLVKILILTLSAARDLDALPRYARDQVEGGLHRYAKTGQGDAKALAIWKAGAARERMRRLQSLRKL